jgi:hypothetical protein
MRRGRSWLLLALLLSSAAVWAADPPRSEVDAEGRVVLSGLPPILGDEEVRRHLSTGLTTTLLFRGQLRGVDDRGGARIGIRYELWDEVFHVLVLGDDGVVTAHQIPSLEELDQWWAELRLVVLALDADPGIAAQKLQLTLDVVPFSQSEGEDTQIWFTRSVSGAVSGEDSAVARSAEGREDTLDQMFSVLMATSIQSRSVISYRWTLEASRRDEE